MGNKSSDKGKRTVKFSYICNQPDGLVLVDKAYLTELNSGLLFEMDVLLDRHGNTELMYDYPNEKWEDVWKRETEEIVDFCNSGKMIVFLHDKDEENCEIKIRTSENTSGTYINVKSGKLILINASELIQCLLYSELIMDVILEMNVNTGMYAVNYDGINYIELNKLRFKTNNVIEL